MSDHHIQLGLFIVGVLGVIGLFAYCVETYKVRRAAENQVEISQGLIHSSMDQVEGMSKPCLTLSSQLRDGSDAILSMDGAIGNIVAGADQGFFVLQNIGTGVAMNVKYHFTRDTDNLQHPSRWRYVPYVVPEGRTTLVEGVTAYNLTHKVTIEYESYGGRKYRTTIQLVRRVITEFTYLEIKSL